MGTFSFRAHGEDQTEFVNLRDVEGPDADASAGCRA